MHRQNLRKQAVKVILLALAPILAGTFGYYLIYGDQYSVVDYLYMTMITVTTTGYGEILDPAGKPEARIFSMVIMVCGMGTLLYAVSALTAFIVEGTFQNLWRRKKMIREIEGLRDHVIVCGYGETGSSIVSELYSTKRKFVIIEQDEKAIHTLEEFNENSERKMLYIQGDASEEEILNTAGIARASGLISSLREDKDNLFVTITARGMNPKMRIVVRVAHLGNKKKFFKAGADSVVSPNAIGGMRLVSEMVRPSAVTFLDSMLGRGDVAMRFEDLPITDKSRFSGKTLKETDLQKNTHCLVMAVKHGEKGQIDYIPHPDYMLKPGMTLVVLGEAANIEKLRNY